MFRLLHFSVLGVAFCFVWFIFCVLHQFKMPLVHIVLAFTFQATSRNMWRVSTFMPTLSSKLVRLLCLCTCVPFLCYTLVLCPLFLKVGFRLSLISFWGYLRFVSCAFDCFIGTFEPFKTRLGRLFPYPLIELLEIRWMSQHGSFSSYCHVGVYITLEKVI